MTPADYRLIAAAIIGIALSIILIIRGRLHPFVGLLCGAFTVGLLAGLPMEETAKAVEKGAGAILGGTGLVVALGLGLGAMLQLSDGAGGLARAALRLSGARGAPWRRSRASGGGSTGASAPCRRAPAMMGAPPPGTKISFRFYQSFNSFSGASHSCLEAHVSRFS